MALMSIRWREIESPSILIGDIWLQCVSGLQREWPGPHPASGYPGGLKGCWDLALACWNFISPPPLSVTGFNDLTDRRKCRGWC